MLRTAALLARKFKFSQYKLPPSTSDLSNVIGYINSPDTPTLTLYQKLSSFSFSNMYSSLDQFSRELLFTFANDYQLGLPAGVVIISFLLRLSYFYPNVKGQIAALKMKQMKPIMNAYTQKMRIAQMSRNPALAKVARQQLRQAQKSRGIDNFYAFINLTQIPFLITWFLSLRYVSALPQIFPSVTQSFLWIPDMSLQDPYWILPILSAFLSSYAITISPSLRSGVTMPLMQPFVKYLKWLPFLSLTFTGFFPAILNLYWFTLAINQVALMLVMNSKYIQSKYGKKQAPKPQIQGAVFVEQKPKIVIQSSQAKVKEQFNSSPLKTQQLKKETPKDQILAQKIAVLSKKPKKPKNN